MDLSGSEWFFRLEATPDLALKQVAEDFTTQNGWTKVHVPMNWQMEGFEAPTYTNFEFPFTKCPALLYPRVPKENPTGVYRHSFHLPLAWRLLDRSTRIIFHGAGSALIVFVDGQYIGYSQDSMTAAEFDITDVLRGDTRSRQPDCHTALLASLSDVPTCRSPGGDMHTVVAIVLKWCDGTYMEDQDQWWLTGIHRAVELVSVPSPFAIADFEVDASLDTLDADGLLDVRVSFNSPVPRGATLELSLQTSTGEAVPQAMHSATLVAGEVSWTSPHLHIPTVLPWSAETPNLYSFRLQLRGHDGQCLQAECCRVGFRSVSVAGLLRISGRPLVVAGANVHEMHPVRGKALREEDMLKDIEMLKRGNFNAVRNSHYPHALRWYELCDEYGLYVVDEANIETHGFSLNGMISLLACDPDWRAQFLHRAQNMFRRARNHPCVIAWSLGNESGWGPNFQACMDWLRQADTQHRPVQYEGGTANGDAVFLCGDGETKTSDLVCPMYSSPEGCVELMKKNNRPLVLCEYAHAMGNAGGSTAAFWNLFWSDQPAHLRTQGGFIWEWADGDIMVPPSVGAPRSLPGFGGDFGPKSGTGDSHFIVDGLLFSNRTPHPSYLEAKRAQQPVHFRLVRVGGAAGSAHASVEISIHNRHTFRSLAHLEFVWKSCDACGSTASGVLATQFGKSTEPVEVSFHVPLPKTDLARCGVWLSLQARLREDEVFAPKDYVVAEQGFTVLQPDRLESVKGLQAGAEAKCLGSMSPFYDPRASIGTLLRSEVQTNTVGVVAARGYQARFADGKLTSLSAPGGPELLESAVTQCFARAPTPNDSGGADFFQPLLGTAPLVGSIADHLGLLSHFRSWRNAGLYDLKANLVSQEWERVPGVDPTLRVKERWRSESNGRVLFSTETRYRCGPDDITLSVTVVAEAARRLKTLPRIGSHLSLNAGLSQLTWVGCGPGESYPDRKAACDWGVHRGEVDEQHVDYLVPCESGGKADVHWAVLREDAPDGAGLLLSYVCRDEAPLVERLGASTGHRAAGAAGAQFSASRWTLEELLKARHSYDLPCWNNDKALRSRPIQVHVDTAHMGVGAAGETPQVVWNISPQYFVCPRKPWTYELRLKPLRA